jgi:hypothetical protein
MKVAACRGQRIPLNWKKEAKVQMKPDRGEDTKNYK